MFHSGRYRCRSKFCLWLLFLKTIKCLFKNTSEKVKYSSLIGRKALKKSTYNFMLPHASTKLHRVHMAVRSNATIIFLVALPGIWLKCRSKIHTDINLNNKQMHLMLLHRAEGMKRLQLSRKHFVFSSKQIISSGDNTKKYCQRNTTDLYY